MTYRDTIVGDTPEVYYRLGESSKSDPMADEMGNNNGTYYAGARLGDPGAIANDSDTAAHSVSDAIGSISWTFDLTTGFTWEAWMDAGEASFSDHRIFTDSNNGSNFRTLGISGGTTFRIRWDGVNHDVDLGANGIDISTYHHYVVTVDGGVSNLYVDGTLISTFDHSSTATSVTFVNIGGGGTSLPMTGPMDEVALYDYVLSDTQIQNHYDTGTSTATNVTVSATLMTGNANALAPSISSQQQVTVDATLITATADALAPAVGTPVKYNVSPNDSDTSPAYWNGWEYTGTANKALDESYTSNVQDSAGPTSLTVNGRAQLGALQSITEPLMEQDIATNPVLQVDIKSNRYNSTEWDVSALAVCRVLDDTGTLVGAANSENGGLYTNTTESYVTYTFTFNKDSLPTVPQGGRLVFEAGIDVTKNIDDTQQANVTVQANDTSYVQHGLDAVPVTEINPPVATGSANALAPEIYYDFEITATTATATSSAFDPFVSPIHPYIAIIERDGVDSYYRNGSGTDQIGTRTLDSNTATVASGGGVLDNGDDALSFDGTMFAHDSAMASGGGEDITGDFSVEAWFKADTLGADVSTRGTIFSAGDDVTQDTVRTTNDDYVGISVDSSTIYFNNADSSSTIDPRTPNYSFAQALNTGEWYHIVITGEASNNGSTKIYLNGSLVHTITNNQAAGPLVNYSGGSDNRRATLGYDSSADSYGFDGVIDFGAMYDSVLDAATIQEHYDTITATHAEVAAPVITANTQANAPTISTDVQVDAALATADGSALAPTISTVTEFRVDVPVMTADADLLTPDIYFDYQVDATLATANSTALTPSVEAVHQIDAPTATGNANALAPASIDYDYEVSAALATADADGLAPTIETDAILTAALATGTGDALAPTVDLLTQVDAVTATGSANALDPTLGTDAVITAPLSTADADMFAPWVGNAIIFPRSFKADGIGYRPVVKTRLNYADYMIQHGAVADWKFDEKDGATVFADTLGDYDATIKGEDFEFEQEGVVNDFGTATLFNLTTDTSSIEKDSYAVTDNPFTESEFSVAAVFKDTRTHGGVLDAGTGGDNDRGFKLYISSGELIGIINTSEGRRQVSATIAANDWVHAVMTYDGTRLRMYINGVLEGQKTYSSLAYASYSSTRDVVIGRHWASRSRTEEFEGLIDHISLFDYALGSDRVEFHYNNSGLVRVDVESPISSSDADILTPNVWPTAVHVPLMTADAKIIEDIAAHRTLEVDAGTAVGEMFYPHYTVNGNESLAIQPWASEADAGGVAPDIETTWPQYGDYAFNLEDRVRAWYPLDDAAEDTSGYDWDGIVVGDIDFTTEAGTVEPTDANTGATFNGGYIDLDESLTFSYGTSWVLTFEFWFKTTADNGIIFHSHNDDSRYGENQVLRIGIGDVGQDQTPNPGHLTVFNHMPEISSEDDRTFVAESSAPVNDGKWHHAVFVESAEANNSYLFLDGVSEGSFAPFGTTSTRMARENNRIGAGHSIAWVDDADNFDGSLDEFAIYRDVVETGDNELDLGGINNFEIIKHYEMGKHRYSREILSDEPEHYYRLGEYFGGYDSDGDDVPLKEQYYPRTTGIDTRWQRALDYMHDEDFLDHSDDNKYAMIYKGTAVDQGFRGRDSVITGDVNGSVELDGSFGYVWWDVENGSAPTSIEDEYTVELWIKPSDLSRDMGVMTTNYPEFESDSTDAGAEYGFDMHIFDGNRLQIRMGNATEWLETVNITYNFVVDTPYHIVVRVDNTDYTVFINGLVVSSGTMSGNTVLMGNKQVFDEESDSFKTKKFAPILGTTADGGQTALFRDSQYWFDGYMDEFAVYSSALATDRIRKHHVIGSKTPEGQYLNAIASADAGFNAPTVSANRSVSLTPTVMTANADMLETPSVFAALSTADADAHAPTITTFTTLTVGNTATATAGMLKAQKAIEAFGTADASMPVPTVSGDTKIVGATATATAKAYAPTVTVNSNVDISPSALTTSANAQVPDVSVNDSIDATALTASADAFSPAVSVDNSLEAGPATAETISNSPEVQTGTTISASLTTATGAFETPGFGSTINAVTATASNSDLAPAVMIDDTLDISLITADTAAHAPEISVDDTVDAALSTASATAPVPAVDVSADVAGETATAEADINAPAISADVNISAPLSTANAAFNAPDVTVDDTTDVPAAAPAGADAKVPVLPNKTILAPAITASGKAYGGESVDSPELQFNADLPMGAFAHDAEFGSVETDLAL